MSKAAIIITVIIALILTFLGLDYFFFHLLLNKTTNVFGYTDEIDHNKRLHLGDAGNNVIEIQRLVSDNGHTLVLSGKFDQELFDVLAGSVPGWVQKKYAKGICYNDIVYELGLARFTGVEKMFATKMNLHQ